MAVTFGFFKSYLSNNNSEKTDASKGWSPCEMNSSWQAILMLSGTLEVTKSGNHCSANTCVMWYCWWIFWLHPVTMDLVTPGPLSLCQPSISPLYLSTITTFREQHFSSYITQSNRSLIFGEFRIINLRSMGHLIRLFTLVKFINVSQRGGPWEGSQFWFDWLTKWKMLA